jgi:AcrR family transcriptional regulator
MTRMEPRTESNRRRQAERRREELLDAALQLFAERGVDGTSVKALAQAAGVTPGLLYHYFESKEALVVALLSERGFLPQLRALVGDLADQRPAKEVLTDLLEGFDRTLAENAQLMSLFFDAGRARPGLNNFASEGQRLISDFLAARMATGELRPHDTAVAAQMLVSSIALARLTGAPVSPAALIELVFPKPAS